LIRIYDFLRSRCTESLPTLNAFEITADARSKSCPICVQAVDIFLEILGGEAANLGLKCLATGGVYIAGGIPSKMRDLVTSGSLLESFLCAGSKFSAVRASFPLYVVLNQDVGLVGAKAVAVQLLDGVAH
jgi:glucokinase